MSALYPIPDFLAAVDAEWQRARVLFPVQEETLSLHEWLAVLTEEVGEVARGLNDGTGDYTTIAGPKMLADLRAELVQVAAMAGRMFAAVDRDQRRPQVEPA